MRNRAKCKLCESVIESFHRNDYVSCKCNEISIEGGEDYFKCSAHNWENFLRIDDNGEVIVPKIVTSKDQEEALDELAEQAQELGLGYNTVLSKQDKLQMLEDMVSHLDSLPSAAMNGVVTNYDLSSFMSISLSLFKELCKESS